MFSSQIYCVTFVNHRCTGGFTYFALHFIHATFCIEPRISGAPLDGSANGVQLTQQALTNEIGASGGVFVAVALFFFAFSSILGNYYYGEANIRFITEKKWVLHSYRILVGGMVLFGSVATLDMVWSLADITMALMAICNLIAILFLGKYAVRLLSDYRAQKKAGIQSPVFKKETMPEIEKDLECW